MDKEELEKLEEEIYTTNYKKQIKLLKILFTSIFGTLSIIMFGFGIAFFLSDPLTQDMLGGGITFMVLTMVMLVMVIIGLVVPSKLNYQKYKARSQKYKQKYGMYYSAAEIVAKIEVLERRIEELEKDR